MLGSWIHDDDLKITLAPTPHILIDNFLQEDSFRGLVEAFPEKPTEDWWSYRNPLEVKYAFDDVNRMQTGARSIFEALAEPHVLRKLAHLFGIPDLCLDPLNHGAGLHMHPRGGRLNMHLDYEKHPILENKFRRLNIILYANAQWEREWKGDTQLWDAALQNCVVQSFPVPNRAIIFATSDESWHGIPDPILCPSGTHRQTLAYYYVSSTPPLAKDEKDWRYKARFAGRPEDAIDPRMQQLYAIRPHRRITEEDMERIWPSWVKDEELLSDDA